MKCMIFFLIIQEHTIAKISIISLHILEPYNMELWQIQKAYKISFVLPLLLHANNFHNACQIYLSFSYYTKTLLQGNQGLLFLIFQYAS